MFHPLGKDGDKYTITQGFYGKSPLYVTASNPEGLHQAIDFSCVVGTPVYATFNGNIMQSYYSSSYGQAIKLSNGPRQTFYGHLNQRLVQAGDKVSEGQIIGYSGNTGNSTGPHLHFELYHGTVRVDPLPYLKEEPVTQREKDFEKMYVIFQILNLSAPPHENVDKDLAHLEGIRLALMADGKTEVEADTLKWDQFFVERVRDYSGRYKNIGERAGIL